MWHRRRSQVAWLLFAGAYAAVHDVEVGGDGTGFSPDTLTAKDGDVISYSFHAGVSFQ